MLHRLDDLLREAHVCVAGIDAALLSGRDAAAALVKFSELEKVAAAGRMLLAKRVDETGAWVGSGCRTAAEWMAQASGGSVGAAVAALDTSWNLANQPALTDAVRAGELSVDQAAVVSSAVKQSPDAEGALVAMATSTTLPVLRDECRKVKARAEDQAARAMRCHKARRAYFGIEEDGMVPLVALYPVPTAAKLRAALEKRTDQIFRERYRSGGEREPRDRYMADALAELLTSAGGGGSSAGGKPKRAVRTDVQVRVDLAALRRGRAIDGEVCDAPGVGELTVGEVETLMAEDDTVIHALLTRGTDVLKIVRVDRYVPADLRRSLEFRDPTCVVDGCNRTARLERDHIDPYTKSKRTSLDNFGRLCSHHHRLKTLAGWVLKRRPDGAWSFTPPDGDVALFDGPQLEVEGCGAPD